VAETFPGKATASTPVDETITRAEALAAHGRYESAISALWTILVGNESRVLWRISRTYAEEGEASPPDLQEGIYDRAIEYARKAVETDPRSSDAHAALAVSLGKKALFAEPRRGVELSREIRDEAEKAIELDRSNCVPYVVLGIWNREIANLGFIERAAASVLYGGLPEASNARSAELLESAVALKPNFLKPHYELAMTRIELRDWKGARKELEEVIRLPKAIDLDEQLKVSARKVLKKLP
jgi:tetratricopeptide (TPR) repeat protein